ncbi:hypothetical protein ABID52_000410 [Fictibacillus halophilus]|uniref:Uncharacterized protein n=1 Tax=Fictibacillus halophilus TaxID=1610490 RepID=A0ABV2LE33_9BACL|nr:hypothetical protein [Fictibacillus halophilus]
MSTISVLMVEPSQRPSIVSKNDLKTFEEIVNGQFEGIDRMKAEEVRDVLKEKMKKWK